MSVFDLKETAQNQWRAKYDGNYGTYTIKMEFDGQKRGKYSCSCPSDYLPCKHIAMVESAIVKRVNSSTKSSDKGKEIDVKKLLQSVPHKELIDFIVKQAQYNPELSNNIALEFAAKSTNREEKGYNQIIRKILKNANFCDDDMYGEYGYEEEELEIEELDKWFQKAHSLFEENNNSEAILILKACVEEYSDWCLEQDSDILEYISPEYANIPFEYLSAFIEQCDEPITQELFAYCKEQMNVPKYKRARMDSGFESLYLDLCILLKTDEFVAYQEKRIAEVTDKNSFEAKREFDKLIDYYNNIKNKDAAWAIITNNIQIEEYRKQYVERLISESNLPEAKRLIQEYIDNEPDKKWHLNKWYELLLEVAKQEKDTFAIRKLAYYFISSSFEASYYRLYKSTFKNDEWQVEVEKLITHYSKKHGGWRLCNNVADVLVAEKQTERLIEYVEKLLLIEDLQKYYTHFATQYPAKTLSLFRGAINHFTKSNLGRGHYEYVVSMFKLMRKIEGGSAIIDAMIAEYRVLYKNRRAMMEIINAYK